MKKYLFFAAMVIVALASCSESEFTGDQSLREANENGAISFGSGVNAVTRADHTGATAATDLGGKFYVWGIKNEGGDDGYGIGATSTGNLVYNNYVVEWTDNSAMTSTSNTEGWEYVGKNLTTAEIACITPNGETAGAVTQTIKYWDFGAYDYTFYAFSADPTDLNATVGSAKVQVAKTTSVTSGTVYDKGYTVTLAAGANLDKLFFSERVNITASANTERTLDNTYGGNVTFRFHNLASKVRVAMYETIPGYKVTINSFKVTNAASPAFSAMTTVEEDNFAANFVNNAAGIKGTMTVKYIASGATQNHPTVSFSPTNASGVATDPANILELGDGLKKDVTIGTTITNATFDKSDDLSTTNKDESYTSVFPKEDNTQNLKLKVCYTLTAVDNSGNATTGETITITDATAEIPAAYLKWKPGFAYTYIFKISDNTNGSSGQGVVGLYPITLDAVTVIAEDGKAEYITTVSEPSITTFGVNRTTGKYVSGGSEYAAGSDIYATIMDGSSVATPVLADNVNLYKNIEAATGYTLTEASLAEAIAETGGSAGEKITYTLDNNIGSVCSGSGTGNGIPGEDGIEILGVPAVKMTNLAAGTYAVEYIKSEVSTNDGGKTYASAEAFAAAGTLYKEAACTNVADATYYASHTGDTYYKKIVNMPGTKVYKIIVVQ